ncbi:hypothetical protein GCM10011386_23610 [Parapedobacter defluvii]|uniref:1,4-alpha-glucan branching enzyme n=2 Tax=Parapedobacter defluvii TaxID=2045106 RepID=A0ABQ1LWB9_9SPHI|nr:hypothetical protein GCM10011386_23610 [Parapedobacter defluvii]
MLAKWIQIFNIMSTSKQTSDHNTIRKWAEQRGGVPAKVRGTGRGDDEGVLRIHFPENSKSDDQLEEISWSDFFDKFDAEKLNFLYQEEKADGEPSTFHKFVNRE